MGEIMTAEEVARYLKLNKITVYKYAQQGRIPGIKIGNRWRFDREKIEELVRKAESESPVKR